MIAAAVAIEFTKCARISVLASLAALAAATTGDGLPLRMVLLIC
jgi:hypothetical protein